MDVWNSYKNLKGPGFGLGQLLLRSGERWNTSLGSIVDKSMDLGINNAVFQKYNESRRYIMIKDMTYDLMFTAYDINSRAVFAARITENIDERDWSRIVSLLRRIRNPNLEFRFIGLQNGYADCLGVADRAARRLRGRFAEFDLFGTSTRHIALDTKTGVPYDLLLLDRIYRAGELACQVKLEDFKKTISKLAFK